MFRAVVFTPGRTGSHLIINNLRAHFEHTAIIHTHNPVKTPPGAAFVGILSKRRNMFDAIMSSYLAMATNEAHTYTTRPTNKFSVPLGDFENTWMYYTGFYDLVDRTKFTDIVEIYYEDMICDNKYLFSQFGINREIDLSRAPGSPRKYQEYILNLDELRDKFNDLNRRGLSDSALDSIRKSISKELADIKLNHRGNRNILDSNKSSV